MTQAQYTSRGKHGHSGFATEYLRDNGTTTESKYGYPGQNLENISKLRIGPRTSRSSFYNADSVIVLTDKPRKPIPRLAEIIEKAQAVTT